MGSLLSQVRPIDLATPRISDVIALMSPPVKPGPFCLATLIAFSSGNSAATTVPASPEPLTELERNAEFFSGLSHSPHLISYPQLDIDKFWISSEWKDENFYVLIPGTSGTVVGKEWPITSFSSIAMKVYQQTGWKGIICGTQQEHILGEQIRRQCDAPLQNLSGQTTLPELAGLLSQSLLAISNDTGSVFISSAVGTPSVCILGGGHFGRFLPYPDLPGQINNLKEIFHKMPCYCYQMLIFLHLQTSILQCALGFPQ